jgi:serine/threonine protein kinase
MHRNIKPANLIVKSNTPPDMAITDLDCATTENEILYDRPGTIPYLAPEQREKLKHGENVDIWALGVVGSNSSDGYDPKPKLTSGAHPGSPENRARTRQRHLRPGEG